MKKIVYLALILLPLFSNAQTKKNALLLGLRGGISNGLSVKKILSPVIASETIVSTRFKGLIITSLLEASYRVEHSNLYIFTGAGAHISAINGKEVSWYRDEANHISLGLDFIFGVDYYLKRFPINVSLDCKPSFSLIDNEMKFIDGAAFSARYSF